MPARCEYAVEHLVKSDDISVGELALIGQRRRIRIGHMPVHIPFNIAYLRAVERFSDAFNNVIAHLLARKIQQKLISAEARLADGRLYRPVRVRAVKLGIDVHALRLEPQSELHPQLFNAVGKLSEAARQLPQINVVVTQPCRVAVSCAEPAVVKDEKLHAELFRSACQFQKLFAGEFKKTGFPVVYQHRALDILPIAAHDVVVDKVVEICAQPVEAALGKGHDRLGRFKALAGVQRPVKAMRIYAELDAHKVVV